MDKNISNIKRRMLEHIGVLGISKRQFYEKTGISNGTLDKEGGVSEMVLEKYISTYGDINLHWLFTGEGSMFGGSKTLHQEENLHYVNEPAAYYERSCNSCREKDTIIARLEADKHRLERVIDAILDDRDGMEKRANGA